MAGGTALGVFETRGMAALMAATDAMLKGADVRIGGRHGIGSGWVTATVTGAVAAVESAVRAGEAALDGHGQLIRARVIARPEAAAMERLPHARAVASGQAAGRALAVLETEGLTPLIAGADAMLKAANVELRGWAFIGGALCHACFSGDVAAVQAALLAGADAAASLGPVHDQLVLAQPDAGLGALLPPAPGGAAVAVSALGVLETTGYVATVAGADAMLKAADVRLERLSIASGGRSLALVAGPLAAVAAAVQAGREQVPAAGGELNAACVVSRPDPSTMACFAGAAAAAPGHDLTGAMGLIETRSTVALVVAMDTMLKAAPVQYEGSYKVGYFLTASVIRGSVGAVWAALDAGAQAAVRHGELVAVHLIPRPYAELEQRLSHS